MQGAAGSFASLLGAKGGAKDQVAHRGNLSSRVTSGA